LVSESPSICLIPPAIVNMPAYHSSISSLSSSSEAHLCHHYKQDVQQSSVQFNIWGCIFARWLRFDPYPTVEEVHNHSNTAVPDDDEFEDLGLNDFIIAQHRIAGHRVECHREFMLVHTCGLISRGVEDWDMGNEAHSGKVEVSIGYVAAIGMATIESDVMLSERVHDNFNFDNI